MKEKIIHDSNGKRQGKFIKTFDRINIDHTEMFTQITISPKHNMVQHLKKTIKTFFFSRELS